MGRLERSKGGEGVRGWKRGGEGCGKGEAEGCVVSHLTSFLPLSLC